MPISEFRASSPKAFKLAIARLVQYVVQGACLAWADVVWSSRLRGLGPLNSEMS